MKISDIVKIEYRCDNTFHNKKRTGEPEKLQPVLFVLTTRDIIPYALVCLQYRKEHFFMYEHMRNELSLKLSNVFSSRDIDIICKTLDIVANDYEITEKSTALVVYEDRFPKLAELYLQSKKLEGISPRSERLYRGRLKIFFEIVQKRPEEITTNDIRCFLVYYQNQNKISDRTLDKFRQILNAFFTWCTDEEYVVKNPCRTIKEIKYEVKPRKSLTRMELERLRRVCVTKRDLAMVDTLYSTGCRVSELVNMKKSDINIEDKSIHIIGKGNKHNTCYFNTNAQISLNEYLEVRKDESDYLFVAGKKPYNKLSTTMVEKIIKDLGHKAGLEITPHIMRHTSATLALQSGMPLTQVQKMLGHASSDTTLIYAEILQDDIKNSHLKYVI